jgi:hypothetical protein
LVVEFAGIGLGAGDPAIEVDVMARRAVRNVFALFRLGCDLDRGGRLLIQFEKLGLAVGRNDFVPVGGFRLGRVVSPLERLDRVLRRRYRGSRRESFILELKSLDAPQIIPLDHGAVLEFGTFDRKSHQSAALCFLALGKIPGKGDDVQAANGAHVQHWTRLELAHGRFLPAPDHYYHTTRPGTNV